MGVIDIRLRQERLGNLPGVRAVDTGALNYAARQQMADAEAIRTGMNDIVGGAINAANAIAAMKEQDNRNEANKLYKDYVTYMDDVTSRAADPNDPNAQEGLFRKAQNDDNAARSLADDLRRTQGEMRSAIGLDKQPARVRELFEAQVFAYDRGHANTANDIMSARFQASRKGNSAAVAEITRRNASVQPTVESLDAYAHALEDTWDAQGIPETQRVALRQNAQEDILAAYLDSATDGMDLYQATDALNAISNDSLPFQPYTDQATRTFMIGTWKTLDHAKRAEAIKAIEAKRDAKLRQTLDALDTAQYEGNASYDALVATRDRFREAQLPEASIMRLNGLVESQRKRDVNNAIIGAPESITQALTAEDAARAIAAYGKTLGKHVTDSPEWVAFAKNATRGNAKAAVAIKQEDAKSAVSQIVYGYDDNRDFVPIGATEKRTLLQSLFRTGQIDIETFNNAVAAVDATEDARTASLAQNALRSWALFRNAGVEGAEPRFGIGTVFAEAINDKGEVSRGALASNIAQFFPDKDDKLLFFDAAQRFQEAYEGWARACAENPTWSQEQCSELFHQTMRYPLEALAEKSLTLDEGQAAEFRRQLEVLSQLAKPIEGNLDWDFTSAKNLMGTVGASPSIGLIPAQPVLTQAQPDQRAQAQAAAAQNPQQPNPQQPQE